MYDRVYKLAEYLSRPNKKLQSHFYRNRRWLETPCIELPLGLPIALHQAIELFYRLEKLSPLEEEDLEPDLLAQFNKLNLLYLDDPKFYRNCRLNLEMWDQFKNLSLREAFETKSFRSWLQKRKQMKRKPAFELDSDFKRTKSISLDNMIKGRRLLRQHPLLRYQDLKHLGITNAQHLIENFSALEKHRKTFLDQLAGEWRLS